MNTRHWKRVIKQCGGNLEKVLPKAVPGKVEGTWVTKPMKSSTISKVEALKGKMGFK